MGITSPTVTSLLNPQRSINAKRLHHFKMLAAIKRSCDVRRNGHSSSLLMGNFTRNDVHLMIRNLCIPREMIKEMQWGGRETKKEKLAVYFNIDLGERHIPFFAKSPSCAFDFVV